MAADMAFTVRLALCVIILVAGISRPALAQHSVSEVLSFLLVNRSIPTGDFVRDEQAAAATRDSISALLLMELATLPVTSSAGAFVYRLHPTLGTVVRASASFGPFFTDRSLTVGAGQASLNVSYQVARFDSIEGQSLRSGALASTASRVQGESEPFDVETLTLRLRTNTTTVAANYGLTDRLDIGGAVPFVGVNLSGQRLDTYRGVDFLQATGIATSSGIGDILARAKFNLVSSGASGLALGGELRFPTGSEENLRGSGEFVVRPRVIGSLEGARLALHSELSYALGGLAREFAFGTAVTGVVRPNVTVIGELAGRRLEDVGRLDTVIEPHPGLSGIETIRLTGVPQSLTRLVAVAGVKWNLGRTWLLSANVMRPLTSAGLNASWVPTMTLDYSFGR
jgi:hypothetical protein